MLAQSQGKRLAEIESFSERESGNLLPASPQPAQYGAQFDYYLLFFFFGARGAAIDQEQARQAGAGEELLPSQMRKRAALSELSEYRMGCLELKRQQNKSIRSWRS